MAKTVAKQKDLPTKRFIVTDRRYSNSIDTKKNHCDSQNALQTCLPITREIESIH